MNMIRNIHAPMAESRRQKTVNLTQNFKLIINAERMTVILNVKLY